MSIAIISSRELPFTSSNEAARGYAAVTPYRVAALAPPP